DARFESHDACRCVEEGGSRTSCATPRTGRTECVLRGGMRATFRDVSCGTALARAPLAKRRFAPASDENAMLRTQYLGLELDSPLILGASPWSLDLDVARRAEDAGASAIVMASLFEEQVCAAGEA